MIIGMGIGIPFKQNQVTLLTQALSILQKYGTNAHVYLPGVGMINGLQAANYLDYTETIGSEQLQNPTFAAATGWTQGSGWTISGGMATATTASGALTQTALVLGQYDQVQITTTAASAGKFDVILGGVKLTTISTVGTFTVCGTAGGTTLSLQGNGYTGVLTLVSVKSVTGKSYSLGAVDSTVGQLIDASTKPTPLSVISTSTITVLGGGLYRIETNTTGRLRFDYTQLKSNVYYKVTFDILSFTGSAQFNSDWCDGVTLPSQNMVVGTVNYTVSRIAYDATYCFLDITTGTASTLTIGNVQIQELTGINAFQATVGSRPKLRKGTVNAGVSDGIGNYSLEFNGTTNYLQMSQPLFQMSDDHAVIAGCNLNGGAGTYRNVAQVSSNPQGQQRVGGLVFDDTGKAYASWVDDSMLTSDCFSGVLPAGPTVLSATKFGNNKTLRVNAVQAASSSTAMGTTTLTAGCIGSFYATAYFPGSIYPIIALKNPTLPDVQVLEKLVGMLTGPSGVYF